MHYHVTNKLKKKNLVTKQVILILDPAPSYCVVSSLPAVTVVKWSLIESILLGNKALVQFRTS